MVLMSWAGEDLVHEAPVQIRPLRLHKETVLPMWSFQFDRAVDSIVGAIPDWEKPKILNKGQRAEV